MRNIFVFLLFLSSSVLFADPITITEDGQIMIIELVNEERSQKLKTLYESRYTYVYITDSIELGAMFSGDRDSKDETMENDEFDTFRKEIHSIPKGEYKVATISMSNNEFLVLGFLYFGNDYFFMVFFTNYYDKEFINLRYDRQRYETIFRNTWNMLF
jgi:hypothetical protein